VRNLSLFLPPSPSLPPSLFPSLPPPSLSQTHSHTMQRCRVGVSGLVGTCLEGLADGNSAGEGLFAKRVIAAGELVCYYNGVRVPHSKVRVYTCHTYVYVYARVRMRVRACVGG
jgi:hypothetical protein